MITINTILDMRPGAVPKIIHLSQYDSDFSLVFRLHASFGTLNIESGTTAEIRGTKKSGTGYSASATLNTTNNTVTVTGDAQMTAVAGQNIYEIVLIKNNKVLGSANFILLVERAALDADTITDASVLRELNAIVEGAETATQAAEDAEDAADRAEAAAQTLEIDSTLTQAGQAADAKATGDAIAQIVPGLSETAKTALLNCFAHVAWVDEHGQDYYDALESALYGYWDYEWSATSGIAPTMMQAYTYNFTDYASENAMFVDNFSIDFNHIGNCEMLFNAKSVATRKTTQRTPQMSICGAQNTTGYDGFKIVYNTPSEKVETNVSGTFTQTSAEYNVYHEYRAKYENGVCYAYIDGTLVGRGSGVVNNAYLYMTGIFGTIINDGQQDYSKSVDYTQMAIKEIKFKVLPYWDYEWSATSETAPTMMQAYAYNFTDYASENAMFVDNFYIDFNHIGNCEILFTAKSLAPSGRTNRTPQLSIRGAQNTDGYNGFKIVYNTPSGKVETSASGTFETTNINYDAYHEYKAKYENGVCYAYIDGTLVGQGSGVVNNAYLYMTGIFGSAMVDGQPNISESIQYTQMAIKEIKFKVLS